MASASAQAVAARKGMFAGQALRRIDEARRSLRPLGRHVTVTERGSTQELVVTRLGLGTLNTKFGMFHLFDFAVSDPWEKYSVLVKADLDRAWTPRFRLTDPLFLRIDSGCETGQLFLDRTCECREQLHLAMTALADRGEGLIISIPRQDGRGLGLPFKLATLQLQADLGLDTVEAATILAPDGVIDRRTYGGAVGILKFLGIPASSPIHLATNNPDKARVFGENGYSVRALIPVVVPPIEFTVRHLRAKQAQLGHIRLVFTSQAGGVTC